MNQKKSFDGGAQLVWDATSLDAFQSCPRKYYYSLLLGIKPKGLSVHLLFGGIYAACLEEFYKLIFAGASFDDAQRAVVRKAMIDSWDPKTNLPKPFEDANKTRVNLIRTLVWYLEEFGVEDEDAAKTYRLKNGEPAVELSFKYPLSDHLIWAGHLDRVVTIGEYPYVMDQKTTGTTISNYYFKGFDLSNQMSGYTMAGRAILETPVKGVIIDAAQVAVNFTRFERGFTLRTDAQLEEWVKGVNISTQYAQHLSESAFNGESWKEEVFPQNPTACGYYGGCPFKTLCSVDSRMRKNYIKSDYQSHHWDPAEAR